MSRSENPARPRLGQRYIATCNQCERLGAYYDLPPIQRMVAQSRRSLIAAANTRILNSDFRPSRRQVRQSRPVPVICRYRSLVLIMHFVEHPPPHVHVQSGDDMAVFDIRTGGLMEGRLPRPQRRDAERLIRNHRQELLVAWTRALAFKDPGTIEP